MSSFYSVLTNKSHDIQEDSLLKDIETHLTDLLNARQYMVSTSQEYGLPDLCSELSDGYSEKLIQAARELITRFEPRLKIQTIDCDPQLRIDTQLQLKVTASVDERTRVHLIATLGAQQAKSVKVL